MYSISSELSGDLEDVVKSITPLPSSFCGDTLLLCILWTVNDCWDMEVSRALEDVVKPIDAFSSMFEDVIIIIFVVSVDETSGSNVYSSGYLSTNDMIVATKMSFVPKEEILCVVQRFRSCITGSALILR